MSDNAANSRNNSGGQKVIEVLNRARAMELNAISQYMDEHFILDDMDYGKLAKNIKLIAIDEMRHAEQFAERIKELDGQPTHEHTGSFKKGLPLKEIYPFNIGLEDDTIQNYNKFMQVCRENNDNISADLFKRILKEEQEHQNYFDNENDHLNDLGQHYLATVAGTPSSTGEPKRFAGGD